MKSKSLRKIARAYDAVLHVCGLFPGLAALFIVMGIAVDVVLRNLGIGSVEWMIEVIEYLLFTLTFVGAAAVLHLNRHVVVDVVVASLSNKKRRRVSIFVNSLMVIICIIFFYYSLSVALSSKSDNTLITKTFTIKEWWLLALLPIAALLLGIESMRRLWKAIFISEEKLSKPGRDAI